MNPPADQSWKTRRSILEKPQVNDLGKRRESPWGGEGMYLIEGGD